MSEESLKYEGENIVVSLMFVFRNLALVKGEVSAWGFNDIDDLKEHIIRYVANNKKENLCSY